MGDKQRLNKICIQDIIAYVKEYYYDTKEVNQNHSSLKLQEIRTNPEFGLQIKKSSNQESRKDTLTDKEASRSETDKKSEISDQKSIYSSTPRGSQH